MVIGERPIEQISDFSGMKKRLQRIGSWVVRKFSGTVVRDAASGFRASAATRPCGSRCTAGTPTRWRPWSRPTRRAPGHRRPGAGQPPDPPVAARQEHEQYVRRSAQTIVRSFALYYPFRFFFLVGLVPFLIGVALLIRWLGLYVFADEYHPRIPSLVLGAVLVIVGVQIWLVGFLGDLQAATRRLLAESRTRERSRSLDEQR